MSEDASGRKEDKDEMLREVGTLADDPNKVSETTLVEVVRAGDSAAVRQRYRMTTTRRKPDGSAQRIELTAVSRDRWVLIKGTWLIRETVTETLDMVIDGKLAARREHAPK